MDIIGTCDTCDRIVGLNEYGEEFMDVSEKEPILKTWGFVTWEAHDCKEDQV